VFLNSIFFIFFYFSQEQQGALDRCIADAEAQARGRHVAAWLGVKVGRDDREKDRAIIVLDNAVLVVARVTAPGEPPL
jgi:hypothetical protein